MGTCKMSRSGQSHARILKVYIETLAGSSHIFSPDGFNNSLLSQAASLKMAIAVSTVGGLYIPRTGKGVKDSIVWAPLVG